MLKWKLTDKCSNWLSNFCGFKVVFMSEQFKWHKVYLTLFFNTRPPMQSLNSPHHAMGPSMSPVGSPYMSSSMGMSGGGMTQCMGNSVVGGATGISSRDYFGDPGSPRSRSAIDSKNYRRSYTHAKPPYR